jgi:hypothetical protein
MHPSSDIEKQNRETAALAERLAGRIHLIAFVLTAIVLAMRLIAGKQDLMTDSSSSVGSEQPEEPAALGAD